jgi:hypothetical protein
LKAAFRQQQKDGAETRRFFRLREAGEFPKCIFRAFADAGDAIAIDEVSGWRQPRWNCLTNVCSCAGQPATTRRWSGASRQAVDAASAAVNDATAVAQTEVSRPQMP